MSLRLATSRLITFIGLILVGGMAANAFLQAETINTLPLPLHDGHYDVKTLCTGKTVAVLPGVYLGVWEDTGALCAAMAVTPGAEVLDVGTGSGILAITALERGARHAVATDINPEAVNNVRLNIRLRGLEGRLEARQVPKSSPGAYSVIGTEDRFDLILCNCPAFDADVEAPVQANAFDPGHRLVSSLFQGLKAHLKPGGKLLMTYWSGAGQDYLQKLAEENDLRLRIVTPPPRHMAEENRAISRSELYKLPMEKIRDDFTGHEQTIIVEVVPRQGP